MARDSTHLRIASANLSDCGKYRYTLFRRWRNSGTMPIMWIMLNPSTADAYDDDPTVRRCMGFSRTWGYDAMFVGNLYAYRSTDPAALLALDHETSVGDQNQHYLDMMAQSSAKIVCAWGNPGAKRRTEPPFCPGGLWHLGLTKTAQPRHPLYLKGDTALQVFR